MLDVGSILMTMCIKRHIATLNQKLDLEKSLTVLFFMVSLLDLFAIYQGNKALVFMLNL